MPAPEIFVAEGVRYVRETAFLELQQRCNTLESFLRSLSNQLAELGIQPSTAADQPAWQLTKIEGPGVSSLEVAAKVQIYRSQARQHTAEPTFGDRLGKGFWQRMPPWGGSATWAHAQIPPSWRPVFKGFWLDNAPSPG